MLERRRAFIINTVYFLLLAAISIAALKLVTTAAMPFVAGFFAAAALNPVIRRLTKRFDMRRRPAGIMILLIFYATLGMLVTVASVRAAVALGELSQGLPELYESRIEPALVRLFELIDRAADRLDGSLGGRSASELGGMLTRLLGSLGSAVSELSVALIAKLSSFAASLPGAAVSLIFTVISSFFFTVEFENILKFLRRALPKRAVELLRYIRERSARTLAKYLKSYLLIMLITFAELALGLTLLGFESALTAALAIAAVDILPVLGTGAVLLTWAAVRLFGGDVSFAVGLAVLWGVITVVRNVIEPKIVGRQVGLHPLVTLVAMYVGGKLFGFAGLVGLPLACAVAAPLVGGEGGDGIDDGAASR